MCFSIPSLPLTLFCSIQLRRLKKTDATLSAELIPYNIVPLGTSLITNAIGFFPEVRILLVTIIVTIIKLFIFCFIYVSVAVIKFCGYDLWA